MATAPPPETEYMPEWYNYVNNDKSKIGDGSSRELPKIKYYDDNVENAKPSATNDEIVAFKSNVPKLTKQNVENLFTKNYKDPNFYNPAGIVEPPRYKLGMESLINITGIKPWNWLNSFFGASYGLYETNFVRRSYNEQVAAPARAPVLGGSITERSQTRQKNRKTKKTKKSFVVANR
jgi:hypothetical protein